MFTRSSNAEVKTNFANQNVKIGELFEYIQNKNQDKIREYFQDPEYKIWQLKDENGYTSFYVEGSETIKGDNSDGKGTIKNLVSIWDYYKEDEVYEAVLEDGSIAIAVEDMEPLYKYNSDYNLGESPKQR